MKTLLKEIPLKSFVRIFTSGPGKKILSLNNLLNHEGNLKVPSNIAIFNMSSATNCPSKKLGLCSAEKAGVKCYAQKSEYAYRPFVLPYRTKQEKFWVKVSANEFVSQFLMINSLKLRKFIGLRLNESGDFHCQEEINKAELIATLLKRYGIKVFCYTSRKDLSFKKCKNLIVSGSGFKKEGISNQFNIIKNLKDRPKGFGICKENCKNCHRCMTRGLKTVIQAH